MDIYKNVTIPYEYMPFTYLEENQQVRGNIKWPVLNACEQTGIDEDNELDALELQMETNKEYEAMIDEEKKYFNNLLSPMTREIMPHINHICDLMEYEGSHMYQDYPDKNYFHKLCDDIHYKVRYLADESDAIYSMETGYNRNSWLRSLVEVMLLKEMHHRRYRHRRPFRHRRQRRR